MTKRFRYKPRSRKSAARLHSRVVYLTDPNAASHAGKIEIEPAKNRFCRDHTSAGFEEKLATLRETYGQSRIGHSGKTTEKRWEEWCYSPPEGADLSAGERELIERLLLEAVFPFVATRTAWHLNKETKRADLHIIVSAYTEDFRHEFKPRTDMAMEGSKCF